MSRYLIRRLLQAIPTLFGVSLLSFMIMSAAPGGPLAALSQDPKMTPAKKAIRIRQLGLDDPWPLQYVRWLVGDDWRLFDTNGDGKLSTECKIDEAGKQVCGPDLYGMSRGILRGDWGYSYVNRRPVLSLIGERLGATVELSILSLIIGASLGILIGILAAVRRGGVFDNGSRVLSVVLSAVPTFWLGLLLIIVFGGILKVLPMGSRCSPTAPCPPIWGRLEYLFLPVLILSTGGIAGYSRYLRASMLDVINQDYVRTARAKGLPDRAVWFVHAARNAMIPLVTFLGPAIAGLLGGAVITETLFSWPGLGRLAIQSVNTLDYPLLMAITMIGAVETIAGFMLSDFLYALVDPRIRLG